MFFHVATRVLARGTKASLWLREQRRFGEFFLNVCLAPVSDTHFPNALPHPRAVMVEPLYAVVAYAAVGTSRRPEQQMA